MELLRLFLPVVFPSWRFFAEIGASPRIHFRTGDGPWRDAMERPCALSIAQRLRRLFWNPGWNEALFLSALAERLLVAPEPWLMPEIEARLMRCHGLPHPPEIRLLFVTPSGTEQAWPRDV
ncbi:hypothetical protein [Gymnodinialimonas sp. 57CJ19]|uniref:hypothetical protein n=1 Tax=Gymnodinialimonas sp. 57CJ19 TaxID=3138498 RepID=UPI003134527F